MDLPEPNAPLSNSINNGQPGFNHLLPPPFRWIHCTDAVWRYRWLLAAVAWSALLITLIVILPNAHAPRRPVPPPQPPASRAWHRPGLEALGDPDRFGFADVLEGGAQWTNRHASLLGLVAFAARDAVLNASVLASGAATLGLFDPFSGALIHRLDLGNFKWL